jgi:hypothetical protein
MAANDRAPLGKRAAPACGAAEPGLIAPLRNLRDAEDNGETGRGCDPQHESPDLRRSRAYIERFRKRIPLGRAIRLMCGSCMGGEVAQMPRGEVAQAIDEGGSCTCPLWPFRFGRDPWRPELSEAKLAAVRRAGEKARRCLEAQRRTRAGSASGHSAGTCEPLRVGDRLMAWAREHCPGGGGAAETRRNAAGHTASARKAESHEGIQPAQTRRSQNNCPCGQRPTYADCEPWP